MNSISNRRQFERLALTEKAIVIDASGREVGPVREVGGGGMLICECGPDALEWLHVGLQLRVTIVEPDSATTNIMDVEVRYITGNSVGMQFISLK